MCNGRWSPAFWVTQQIRRNVKVNVYVSRLLILFRLFAVCSTPWAIFISENAMRAPEFLRRIQLNQTAPPPPFSRPSSPPLPSPPSPFLRTGLTRDKLINADSCTGMESAESLLVGPFLRRQGRPWYFYEELTKPNGTATKRSIT